MAIKSKTRDRINLGLLLAAAGLVVTLIGVVIGVGVKLETHDRHISELRTRQDYAERIAKLEAVVGVWEGSLKRQLRGDPDARPAQKSETGPFTK